MFPFTKLIMEDMEFDSLEIFPSENGHDLLLDAIQSKQTESAKLLIINGCKVNIKDNKFSDTPLHLACMNGDVELTKMLLDRHADINATGAYGETPLHIALNTSQVELVQLLWDRGASVSATNDRGETPLHFKKSQWHVLLITFWTNIFMLLLSKGADVNANTKDNLTPHIIASKDGHQSNIKLLLKCGANVDDEDAEGNTVLRLAVRRGSPKIVRNILKFRPDVNNKNIRRSLYAALHRLYRKYHGKIVENLCNYSSPFDADIADNDSFLYVAIHNGYSKIVEHLKFSSNVNMANDDFTLPLLHTALAHRHDKVAKALLHDGADVNVKDKDGRTPMFYAIRNKDLKIAELLLSTGVHVTNSDDEAFGSGTSPLMLAARQGNDTITRMILSKGVNVDFKQKGRTALHKASRSGNQNVAEILLQHGADPDSRDQNGQTPLKCVYDEDQKQIIEILFKYGADFNSRDKNGSTVLHVASAECNTSIFTILLEYGSNVNIISKRDGRTPLDKAIFTNEAYGEEYGFGGAPKILEEHILKRAAANLYVSERNLRLARNNDFYRECEDEVEKMRQEKVCQNNNVSFYNILSKGINQWASYARNENISRVLESRDYKKKFPIYASMIDSRFKRGRRRGRLINSSTESLNSLLQHLLPDYLIEKSSPCTDLKYDL